MKIKDELPRMGSMNKFMPAKQIVFSARKVLATLDTGINIFMLN